MDCENEERKMDLILAEPIDVKSQERQVEFLGYQTRTRCAREHWP